MKINKFITTGFFLLLIGFPLVLQVAGIPFEFENTENRRLEEFPRLTFKNVKKAANIKAQLKGGYNDLRKYKNKWDRYYKDNFILKPVLFDSYNHIQSNLFLTNAIPKKVVKGTDGWLFLGDSYSNVILESKGIINFSEDEVLKIKQNLLERKKWLQERNIDYYVVVVPNKHTVYGAFLPIKKAQQYTKLGQLKKAVEKEEIHFLDLSELYNEHPDKKLYHKTDSHWNDLGAFLAYKALLDAISRKHPEVTSLTINDLKSKEIVTCQEELTRMLNIERIEEKLELTIKKSVAKEVSPVLRIPVGYVETMSKKYEKRYINKNRPMKVLVFGDSYGPLLLFYLKESFGETILIRCPEFNKEILDQEKPDIVIREIVERQLDILLTK